MSLFIPPKRKLLELLILGILCGVFYLIYSSWNAITLFVFGFIWNWSASNDMTLILENKRYRMSLLKFVCTLQYWFLKPFSRTPLFIRNFVKILPAGLFWSLVIYINDSDMPWWAPFLGSLSFELLQLEIDFLKRHKEVP